jgi:hypothetical protein
VFLFGKFPVKLLKAELVVPHIYIHTHTADVNVVHRCSSYDVAVPSVFYTQKKLLGVLSGDFDIQINCGSYILRSQDTRQVMGIQLGTT